MPPMSAMGQTETSARPSPRLFYPQEQTSSGYALPMTPGRARLFLEIESIAFRDGQKRQMILPARLVSITIFVLFSLSLPARAQSFNRQDLDCAVAATIERARAGTTRENSSSELAIFFIDRLVARDDQTNWARVVYDRSKLNHKGGSAELLAKCTELYLQSIHR